MNKERLKDDYKITKDKSSTSKSLRSPKMSKTHPTNVILIFLMINNFLMPPIYNKMPLNTNLLPKLPLT